MNQVPGTVTVPSNACYDSVDVYADDIVNAVMLQLNPLLRYHYLACTNCHLQRDLLVGDLVRCFRGLP